MATDRSRPRVAHLLRQLGRGGASRAALLAAKYTPHWSPTLISLLPPTEPDLGLARAAGLEVAAAPEPAELWARLAQADVVHVHYWNSPELFQRLLEPWPPARVLAWTHVAGDHPPQVIPPALARWADAVAVSSRHSLSLPALAEARTDSVHVIPQAAELEPLEAWAPRPHDGFHVGYAGTVDFAKMHPEFVALCAAVRVPEARFIVWGLGGMFRALRQQAAALGIADRMELRGFAPDIGAALAEFDILGYPLAPGNYATGELVLQEAMFMGVPPVVLDQPTMRHVVRHNVTGLIAANTEEYPRAIEYLYHHPEERARLSRAAHDYARAEISPARVGQALEALYAALMDLPKRPRLWPRRQLVTRWPGAEAFVSSLGAALPEFSASLGATEPAAALEAEREIAQLPAALVTGTGGILDYARCYPGDGLLRLWGALTLEGQGRAVLALAELHAARRLGLGDWRVDWHIVRVAEAANAGEVAEAALERVLRAAPDFRPARALAARRGSARPQAG
jgi:glycosyltransferase involved in cell wall biosynthesis